jgi:hypothetical protein
VAETTTTKPSWPGALGGLVLGVVGIGAAATVATNLNGGKLPTLTAADADVIAFGAWLIWFGLTVTLVAFVAMLAGALAQALATSTTVKDGEALAGGADDALKTLIGSAKDLVATPAGVGAFIMIVGAILVVGVIFAEPPAATPAS